MTLKSRLKDLERINSAGRLVIIVSFLDEDEAGNPVETGMSVYGAGWGVKQADGETQEAFRARAELVASQHGYDSLWDGPSIHCTIGGEE